MADFASIEAAIILATVGQRYRFTLDPTAVIEIKPQITLLPGHGMPVTFSIDELDGSLADIGITSICCLTRSGNHVLAATFIREHQLSDA